MIIASKRNEIFQPRAGPLSTERGHQTIVLCTADAVVATVITVTIPCPDGLEHAACVGVRYLFVVDRSETATTRRLGGMGQISTTRGDRASVGV